MKTTVLAKRYAEAFMERGKLTIGVKKAVNDVQYFRQVIGENPGFMELMKDFMVTCSEKCEFVSAVLSGSCSPEFLELVKLLIVKRRTGLIPEVMEEIVRKYQYEGEEVVILKTALPLEEDNIRSIRERLEKKLGKRIELFTELDPGLLGGIQILIGNTLIDGSVKRQIGDLKTQLKTVSVV